MFNYLESHPKSEGHLPQVFRLNDAEGRAINAQAAILRIVCGCVNFSVQATEEKFKIRTPLIDLGGIGAPHLRLGYISKRIGDGITLFDLAGFIEKSRRNRDFYEDLLLELSFFLYHKEKGEHTSAFLYLYRIIELISYCFPLIYSSRTPSFMGTYSTLQKFFTSQGDEGDLKFFENFIKKENILKGYSIDVQYGMSADFDSQGLLRRIKELYGREAENLVVDDHSVKIPFERLGGLAISIRNRYFHFSRKNEANFSPKNVYFPPIFFEALNRSVCEWFSSLYIYVLESLFLVENRSET